MATDITFEQVNYSYQAGTPFAVQALKNINLQIKSGTFTAVIGQTGSGKSTLIQHLNALLKPSSGTVTIGDQVITNETNNKHLKPLRKKVGMVFQFPENQLFEETVLKDIAFGPQNFGVSEADANELAKRMAGEVGLDESLLSRSPFDLSGGQMRRVAIAGVLALEPEVLVLDEPTAGLDPRGRLEIMQLVTRLREEQGLTIVLITHQMDDVADYADHVLVMGHGELLKQGTPREIFSDPEWLTAHQLGLPSATRFAYELQQAGFEFETMPLTVSELADEIAPQLGKGDDRHE
ncbi:energy-coupling factor ABC transporter ATP-binding protein [Lactobacillus sp. LC28-10]|uniref:Energy-coupling factor transporter ATP-binding protein EcfA2 n=1 Tax=Secundilactobacillus angelensis TaxID=2722706 RepID=A0ABX1L160_9LACO|nr:energy-coupling factor ABC transporter ATP-binding protein [Secundilactobacillus angelensis]MCH5462837.1 energy-coupling factor ABC transporter ATP-binding protein [Secundilactobacillus angelensis]NLR19250.1 energy-coupling factor ABC transporter ATP-binding protein [Secundilactobacillus angelensis]